MRMRRSLTVTVFLLSFSGEALAGRPKAPGRWGHTATFDLLAVALSGFCALAGLAGPAAAGELGHRPEAPHHLLHLLELPKEIVDLGGRGAAPPCDPQPSRAVENRGV